MKKTPPAISEAQAIAWLRANRHFLNVTGIGKLLGISAGDMSKIVNDVPDYKGYYKRIPAKCLPAISEIIKQLGTIPAISEA